MKRTTSLFLISILLAATACNRINKGSAPTLNTNPAIDPDSVSISIHDPGSVVEKRVAPQREGWNRHLPSLYGDVAEVTLIQYLPDASGKPINGCLECKEVYKFNKRGNVVEKREFDSDGTLWNKCLYKYSADGKMVEQAWYKKDGSLDWKATYKRDDKENFIEETSFNGDGTKRGLALHKYNEKGVVIEEANYDGNGGLQWVAFYKYDSKGCLIEDAGYYSNGVIDYKFVNRYDSNGNIIESTEYNADELPIRNVVYKYNSKGEISEEEIYNSGSEKLETKWFYTYDAQGNVVKISPLEHSPEPYNIVTEYSIVYRN